VSFSFGRAGSGRAVADLPARNRTCNPYDQHGVLNVNLTVPGENMWQPIAAPPDCQPVDYLSLLHRANTNDETLPELNFLQNRTIVIFGDSVDRE
jgi:hypothetical protein